MRVRGPICISAAALLGACAAAPGPQAGGVPAARHVVFEGAQYGFFNYEAGGIGIGEDADRRPSDEIITIVSRDGQPVTGADHAAAARLARMICEEGGREFYTRSPGVMLRRGGISFAGACSEW